MPQLNKKKAKAVESASGGFRTVPDGVYTARLTDVKVKPGAEADVWWAFFTIDEGGDHDDVELLSFLSLSDKAAWKMREFFDAFGVPADTHTDELLGEKIRLSVSLGTAQQGKNKGKPQNSVDSHLALDGDGSDDSEDDGSEEPF